MKIKKLLSLILAVLLLCGSVPIAFAETTVPAYSLSHGDTFTLGRWPQSEVKDAALLSELNSLSVQLNSYGYKQKKADADGNKQTVDMSYGDVEYGGELYRKVVINEYRPLYTLISGKRYEYYQEENGYPSGATYWFRWDPVKWRVLAKENDGVYALSDMILDAQSFHESGEIVNWEGCTLRSWLNQNFYSLAFSDNEKSKVLNYYHQNEDSPVYPTTVKGGADTTDFVWVLSYSDSINPAYGFSSTGLEHNIARRAQGSDYAKSQGLWVSYSTKGSLYSYYGNSKWWLRTPGDSKTSITYVNQRGFVVSNPTNPTAQTSAQKGVRPAFKLNLSASVSLVERADDSTDNKPVQASSLMQGDTFKMGRWPQSKVTDASLLKTLNSLSVKLYSYNYKYDSENRPYQTVDMSFGDVEYDGEVYRKVVLKQQFRPYYTSCSVATHPTFSYQDENGYMRFNTYWFRWDPIKWRVLANEDDGVYVISDLILDSQTYNDFYFGNYWEGSNLRTWLSKTFYRSAFSANEKSKMINYYHENENSHWKESVSGGKATTDKIWILSYSDAVNPKYGFSSSDSESDIARTAQGSDYAKAQGLHVSYTSDETYGNAHWWLRSPGLYDFYVANIYADGSIHGADILYTTCNGVRPVFKLNLSSSVSSADPVDILRIINGRKPCNGASLTLNNGIEQSVYFDATAYDIDIDEGAIIKVTYNKNSNVSETPDIITKTYKLNELEPYIDPYGNYTGTYKFDFKFAPAQITENVTLALYADETSQEPLKTITYSVKDYCNAVINKSDDENLVALCKAILDYGAAAQLEFNYNTDNMAVDEFYNKETIEALKADDIKNAVFSSEFDVRSGSFICTSNLDISLLISSPVKVKGISIDGMDVDDTKAKAIYIGNDGEKYINISGIEARYLNKDFTVNTSSGNLTMNIAFLAKRYISENRNPDEINLAKTIYLYANAAEAYFDIT